MNYIKTASPSPRICDDGSIHWYEGDTFVLDLKVNLTDSNGEHVKIGSDDFFVVSIEDKLGGTIYEGEFYNTDTLRVEITEEVSNDFRPGTYNLTIRYYSEFVTTIVHNSLVVVE